MHICLYIPTDFIKFFFLLYLVHVFSYSTAGGGKPLFRSSGGKNGLPGAYLAFSNIALDFISSLVGKPKCF